MAGEVGNAGMGLRPRGTELVNGRLGRGHRRQLLMLDVIFEDGPLG